MHLDLWLMLGAFATPGLAFGAIVSVPGGAYRPFYLPRDWQTVTTVAPFRIDAAPVTNAQLGRRDDPERAAGNVSWFAARAFCNAAGGHLPTTEQWDYAAAAGAPAMFTFGSGSPPHAYGVGGRYDVDWEWTDDFASPVLAADATQPFICGSGAGFADAGDYASSKRFAFRATLKANAALENLGFRCAYSADAVQAPASPTSTWRDQTGTEIDLTKIEDRPVLAAMFYADCEESCPLIIEKMRQVERRLPPRARDGVRFMLASFDPRDTPQRLEQILAQHHLNRKRWTLMTGDDDAVRELAARLDIKYRRTERGGFVHASALVVLDERGQVAARVDDLSQSVEPVVKRLAQLVVKR